MIVGEKAIGKTCLIKRCVENSFSATEDVSMGAVFFAKKFKATVIDEFANKV